MADVIEKIPLDGSFAVVLIEQRWTIELKENVTKAGGVLLAQGQVSPLALVDIQPEMAAACAEASGEKGRRENV